MLNIGMIQSMVHQLVSTFTKFNSQEFVMEKAEDFDALGKMCDAGSVVALVGKKALADGIVDAGEAHQLDEAWKGFTIAAKHFALEVKDIHQLGSTAGEDLPDIDDPVPT